VNLELSAEQQALARSLDRLLTKLSDHERVREIEERGGFDADLWNALGDLGVPTLAAPGAGATMVDLAVVAERCGAHLASAPVVEALVAARRADPGDRLVVFHPRPLDDGGPVAGAAVADAVVGLLGDELVRVELPAARPALADLGSRAAAAVDPDVAPGRAVVGDAADFARAQDEWRVLSACWAAGLARRALDIGVQYAKDREQFGVPIASFQSIQHRLADAHTHVDGARLLALEAAWAADVGDDRADWLAVAALAWCGEQAEAASTWSLHVHGGYGFMVEYAIHLYVKRARALRSALGRPAEELALLAERRWGVARPGRAALSPAPVAAGDLDFGLGADTEAFRAEVRAFVDEHVTDEVRERARTTGTMHDWGLHRALAERGYLSAGWPTEVGGQGRSPLEVTALQQELFAAGAPVDGMGIASMVAATLVLEGNEWQRAEVLPRLLRGEILPSLGYSEPDAGSDVAAVATRAVRDGDEWIIDGQKMFTTMAHEAAYVFLLARTSPDKPKHKGLTMFLVPTDSTGVSVTPVHTLGGERTNITWYDGVRVPDTCRVGEVDAGWSVMHAALVYERNGANWGEPHRLLESFASVADRTDPLVAAALGRHATCDEVGRLLLYRSAWLAAEGALPLVEGSMSKLFQSEWFTSMSSELLDHVGPAGTLGHGVSGAVLDGMLEHAFRHSTVTTIYGGTSEVQRGIIAERGLGLPRSR
jgi:alkylation response protein AidB-like acyl-CoA dehydrogenase